MPVMPSQVGEEKTTWERLVDHMPEPMIKDMLDEMDRKRFGRCVLEIKGAKVAGMEYTVKTRPDDYEM
jgi:hypothetical protein